MPQGIKQNSKLPFYESPPVSEVVCGIRFKPLDDFKVPHYGLFWQEFKDDFPSCQHAAPLGDLPDYTLSTGFPVPRIWFINKNEDNLIQLQNDRILFNWRRISSEDKYPRYEYVIESFLSCLSKLSRFFVDNDIGTLEPIECELSYINHVIEDGEWEGAYKPRDIMRDFSWCSDERFLPSPTIINWQAAFPLPDGNGNLSASFRPALRKSDKKEISMLEMSAKGINKSLDLSNIQEWYDLAHTWIVNGFTDLTNPDIQSNIWRRQQ